MKKLSVFLIAIFFAFSVAAQEDWHVFSESGRVLAYTTFLKQDKQYVNRIEVYSMPHQKWIASFDVKAPEKAYLDTLVLSSDGSMLWARQHYEIKIFNRFKNKHEKIVHYFVYVFNVRTGDVVKVAASEMPLSVAFANLEPEFTITLNSEREMYSYNNLTGDREKAYKFPPNTVFSDFFYSADDKYLVGVSQRGRITLWQNGTHRYIKRFTGSGVRFVNNHLIYTRNSGNRIAYYVHELPSLQRLHIGNSGIVLRSLDKTDRDYLREITPRGESFEFFPLQFDVSKSGLNPSGTYLTLYATRPEGYKRLVIVDVLKDEVVMDMEETDPVADWYPYYWENDGILMARRLPLYMSLYSVPDNQLLGQGVSLFFDFSRSDNGFNFSRQMRHLQFSPDYRYSAIPFAGLLNQGVYFKTNLIEQQKSSVPDVRFMRYDPQSNYALLTETTTNQLVFTKMADVESGMYTNDLPLYRFLDRPTPEEYAEAASRAAFPPPVPAGQSQQPLSRFVLNDKLDKNFPSGALPGIAPQAGSFVIGEEEIFDDAEAPEGYSYAPIKRFEHISNADSATLVNLHLKTFAFDDSLTTLQVHLTDTLGTYFYGAGSEEWKHIWCNLLLRSPNRPVQQVTDFTITEYSQKDSLPMAIALVLDHSGSMGTARARALQKGAELFIKQKAPEDQIAIIKYDGKVVIEAPLSKNSTKLRASLEHNGLSGFGGATALLDAVRTGVAAINRSPYRHKAVVILTDGNENASFSTKGQVIKSAIMKDVNIYTVGFGQMVSENYLQTLSQFTEGSFYHIFSTADFKWIFDDIEKRMKNYYAITLRTDTVGQHTVMLKICPDKGRGDSLISEFDNTPLDWENIDVYDDSLFSTPPHQQVELSETSEPEQFNVPDIQDFSQITVKTPDAEESLENLTTFEEKETYFYAIEFPDIQFELNSDVIVNGTEAGIDKVVEFLLANPELRMEIRGHTDNTGTTAYNQELSLQRAQKIKELLLTYGIESYRLRPVGFGDTQPKAGNDTEEGKTTNRRVEFKLIEE